MAGSSLFRGSISSDDANLRLSTFASADDDVGLATITISAQRFLAAANSFAAVATSVGATSNTSRCPDRLQPLSRRIGTPRSVHFARRDLEHLTMLSVAARMHPPTARAPDEDCSPFDGTECRLLHTRCLPPHADCSTPGVPNADRSTFDRKLPARSPHADRSASDCKPSSLLSLADRSAREADPSSSRRQPKIAPQPTSSLEGTALESPRYAIPTEPRRVTSIATLRRGLKRGSLRSFNDSSKNRTRVADCSTPQLRLRPHHIEPPIARHLAAAPVEATSIADFAAPIAALLSPRRTADLSAPRLRPSYEDRPPLSTAPILCKEDHRRSLGGTRGRNPLAKIASLDNASRPEGHRRIPFGDPPTAHLLEITCCTLLSQPCRSTSHPRSAAGDVALSSFAARSDEPLSRSAARLRNLFRGSACVPLSRCAPLGRSPLAKAASRLRPRSSQ